MAGRRGHGEGSIYQRKSDNKWVGTVDLGWVDGKRKRKVVYGATRASVRERMAEVQRQLHDGTLSSSRQRLGPFLEDWLTVVLPSANIRPSTVANYALVVRKHLIPGLGHYWLEKLRPEHVQRFLNEKAATLGPRSVQNLRTLLGAALQHAEKWGYVTRNVARLTNPPRLERKEVVPLSPAEARRLLLASKDDRLYALYAVALAIGLRKGEVSALRWDEVNFDEATLRVTGTLKRMTGEGLVRDEPKTKRSRRTVPLPEVCMAALRAHRIAQAQERLAQGERWQDLDYVFTTAIGTPLDPRNLTRQFAAACKRAKLPATRFHNLRHTCASLLLAQGVQPRVVMETLGHSGIAITMDLYTHVMPSQQREAADRMQSLLG